jgi:hypothetical protein
MARKIKVRENGFESEIAVLLRLRSALRIDRSLDRSEVDETVRQIDALTERLCALTHTIQARTGTG